MTAERLEQYRDLKREIIMLENSIKRLAEQTFAPVSDTVSGSMPEYPYIKCVVKIVGMDVGAMERLERRKIQLIQRRQEAQREVEEIEKWIASVQDSRMRQIITLRVIHGRQWRQIARHLGGDNKEDGVRIAFARFMGKS